MSINGRRDRFAMADFAACERTATMKRGRAKQIVEQVRAPVSRWAEFAQEAGALDANAAGIAAALRLDL